MEKFKYIFRIGLLLLAVSMLTGCGSSKKFARDAIYDTGKKTEKKAKESKKSNKGNSSKKVDPNRVKDASAQAVVREASYWLGAPYRYGGHSKSGTDCSGLVMEVYKKTTGIKMPRSAREQCDFCQRIDRKQLAAGDLVFFAPSGKSTVNHVGIYIGDGNMIHASSSRGVMVSGIEEAYFAKRFRSAGRVPGMNKGKGKNKNPEVKNTPERKDRGKVLEIRADQLDELLNQKLDSIYGR